MNATVDDDCVAGNTDMGLIGTCVLRPVISRLFGTVEFRGIGEKTIGISGIFLALKPSMGMNVISLLWLAEAGGDRRVISRR
ncbi:hypothetical protein [Bifidobacterium sp. ESL0704]|uniref:hypothetical protein n=1 Tax=Bifidobacterium sp. ESL0704 TaxID=2983219 RepID=UPI0023F8B755|nr:hypothetical protein [Bifidobacterium sp. ESL0704]WEV53251.1 hypothetical protein OZX64_01795 [Bifidobacterium sp. ESL0704]